MGLRFVTKDAIIHVYSAISYSSATIPVPWLNCMAQSPLRFAVPLTHNPFGFASTEPHCA